MTDQRLEEIYKAVIVDGFYNVGRDPFLSTDISHQEMKELVALASAGKPFVKT